MSERSGPMAGPAPDRQRRRLLAGLGAAGALALLRPGELPAALAPGSAELRLQVSYGDLGPRMVAAGVIVPERFEAVYRKAGQPLSTAQRQALRQGSDEPIVVSADNAYFLLNFFWGVGLANRNPVLTRGPMVAKGLAAVGNFASTGGWSLGAEHPVQLYARERLVELDQAQQQRLWQVSSGVYRPCCGNPTSFPDCNHGMAMLGLLELLASRGADSRALYQAAYQANRHWYPQQSRAVAAYLRAKEGVAAETHPARAVGRELFSGQGFRGVGQWLQANGLAPRRQGGGRGCSV